MSRSIPFYSIARVFCLSLLGWGLIALPLFVQVEYMTSMPWKDALRMVAGDALGWAATTTMIYFATKCLPLEKSTWRRSVPLHIGTGVAALLMVAFAHAIIGMPSPPAFGKRFFPPMHVTGDKFMMGNPPGPPPDGGPHWLLLFGFPVQLPILLVIMAMAHAFHFYVRAQEREKQTLELTAGLAKARIEALKMQIQPHFLFNALNSIAELVHKDADAADEMVGALSGFLRCTLASPAQHEVSLEKELEFLDNYLAIEFVRFNHRLRYEKDVPLEMLGASVPMLILQPLVENSIRHGLGRTQNPMLLKVTAHRESQMLHLCVSDNGPGPAGALKEGIGLSNVQARLRELYGSNARVEVSTVLGFKVTLVLPFQAA